MGLFVPFLFLIASSGGVHAWGKDGHYIICRVAEKLMKSETRSKVHQILNGDFAAQCSWADDAAYNIPRYFDTKPLHYANPPEGACNFDYQRDCKYNICVVGAIIDEAQQLRNPQRNYRWGLHESLLFFSHFMGDVHQPLHVANKEDHGGNDISVQWFGINTNLHKLWDTGMLIRVIQADYQGNPDLMVNAILFAIEQFIEGADEWRICSGNLMTCPDKYADESANLACVFAYTGLPISNSKEYFSTRYPIVEKRIIQAAVRLASALDKIFDDGPKS